MAVDKTKFHRKVLNVPRDLARRVREYRFQRRLENDTEAYKELLEKGLSAAEGEERAEEERREGSTAST